MPNVTTVQEAEVILKSIPEYDPFTKNPKSWWNIGEVADALGIGDTVVRGWCEKGFITGAVKHGGAAGWRMPRSGLLIWLARKHLDPTLGN